MPRVVHIFRSFVLISLVAAMLFPASVSTGYAKDCKLVQLAELPIIANASNNPLVTVQFGGQPRTMLIDTGGYWSLLSPEAGASFPRRITGILGFLGVGGFPLNSFATVSTVEIGPIKVDNVQFALTPQGYLKSDGTLGANFLKAVDVEIDPLRSVVSLFSQDHCDGQVAYWPHDELAVIPMEISRGQITIRMKLDGEDIRALIDTGTEETLLNARTAKRLFNIDGPDDHANQTAQAHQNPTGVRAYRRQFKSLEMDGIAFKNPWITIALMSDRMPDMILGMHHLSGLHLFFAYGEEKLYASGVQSSAPRAVDSTALGDASANPIGRINARDMIEKANQARRSHDEAGALAAIEQALKFDPTFGPAYLVRAEIGAAKEDNDNAIRDLTEAIKFDPQDPAAFLERSRLYRLTGDDRDAMIDANQAVQLKPNSPIALNYRCWLDSRVDRQENAVADCTAALFFAPHSATILENRAFAHLSASRFDEAIADYDATLKINPRSAPSLYGRAQAKRRKGDAAGADADEAAARGINPKIAETFGK